MYRKRPYRRKNKTLKRIIILAIVLSLFGFIKYEGYIKVPVDENNTENYSFMVKKGEPVSVISKNLKEKGLIKSGMAFSYYAKTHNLDKNIIAGRFILNKSMNVPEILESLTDPTQSEFVITIQEGLRISDIENKLIDLGLVSKGDFKKAVENFDGWNYYPFIPQVDADKLELKLEGFLYPDTYFLDPNDFKSEDLIYLALDNFENKWNKIDSTNSEKLKKHGLHAIITMASIIENEVFGKEDRRKVSDILWRRYENSWPIGADATLLYITNDRKISSADLEIDSPYNTRKFRGLPPGPISNPSIEAIEAALYPSPNKYWFYLTTLDTGEVIYSISNEEHNENRRKHL